MFSESIKGHFARQHEGTILQSTSEGLLKPSTMAKLYFSSRTLSLVPCVKVPKDLLYGELATGSRRTGRPQLRYRDVVKRDMKAVGINTETWENLAADRSQWRGAVTKHLKIGEDKLKQEIGRAHV